MSVIDFWQPNPTAFDTYDLSGATAFDLVMLGNNVLPGICKVEVEKGRKLDVKQNAGSHGATITDQGYEPGKVTITLTMWSPSQWSNLQAMWPTLEPPPNGSYKAPSLSITHPDAQIHGIDSVIIRRIKGPRNSTTLRGAREVIFECEQFFLPPKLAATNTPQGSVASRNNALTGAGPTDPSTQPLPAAPTAP